MTDQEALYRLLFRTLIEIRVSAHETGNKLVFELADALHNAPAALATAASADEVPNYTEILSLARQRLDEQGRTTFHQQAAKVPGDA